MTRFAPSDLGELRDVIGAALAAEEPLELFAGATKRKLGRHCNYRERSICRSLPESATTSRAS